MLPNLTLVLFVREVGWKKKVEKKRDSLHSPQMDLRKFMLGYDEEA